MPDVLVIGGGPAGISAAIWCADLGFETVLIEASPTLGGQLLWTHGAVTNYPGVRAKDGSELANRFVEHVTRSRVSVMLGESITRTDLSARTVEFDGGRKITGGAIIIATGVRRRRLNIPGECDFAGRGMLVSGVLEQENVAGRSVVIVGGGDAALENALILSGSADRVAVVHRGDSFTAREYFVSAIHERSKIVTKLNSQLEAILGDSHVRSVILNGPDGRSSLPCEAVLIRIGVEPNTDLFQGQVELDEDGYLVVDEQFRSTVDRVWAIGDVTNPVAMTIANAVGQGSAAAKSIVASR